MAIGLGSNLGDRLGNLRFGLSHLRRILGDVRVSSVYETEPAYDSDQPAFLNACATGRTSLTARQLLAELKDVEQAAGRLPRARRWGPRTLDLDILLYSRDLVREPGLVVPHPRMRERAFVLVPLSEIAGASLIPATAGEEASTVDALAAGIDAAGVQRTEWDL